MIHPPSINSSDACILAVEALDNIVTGLVKAGQLKASPKFLDWVADEATPLVERSVINAWHAPRFVNSLRAGSPKVGMTLWVRHWVSPLMALRFPELSLHTAHGPKTDLHTSEKPWNPTPISSKASLPGLPAVAR